MVTKKRSFSKKPKNKQKLKPKPKPKNMEKTIKI